MDYSTDSHSYPRRKHDSFLSPNSYDVSSPKQRARSSTRHEEPSQTSIIRNRSAHDGYHRDHNPHFDHAARTLNPTMRREETYPQRSYRSRSRHRRSTWPPAPSVEDEADALSKEFPRRKRADLSSDEVCMRGTIDQIPIFIELENRERRFVILPQNDRDSSTGSGSQSDEERSRRERRKRTVRPSLKIQVEESDILAGRQPSPYAFTRPSQVDGERTSKSEAIPSHLTSASATTPRSPHRSDTYRTSRPYKSYVSADESLTEGSDLEADQAARLRLNRPMKPRVSFSDSSASRNVRPEPKRYNSDYTSPIERRRVDDSNSTLKSALKKPKARDDERPFLESRAVGPGPVSVPISEANSIPNYSQSSRYYDIEAGFTGRADRATKSERVGNFTPPGSPQIRGGIAKHDFARTNRSYSRPNSPTPPSSENETLSSPYKKTRLPLISGRGSQSTYPELPSKSSSGSSMNSSTSILPYPTDDPIIQMPNHEHYYVETPTSIKPDPFNAADHAYLPRNGGSMSTPTNDRENTRAITTDGMIKASAAKPEPLQLPSCPRQEWSIGHTDWYTLRGDKSFDVCSSCYRGIIRDTQFRAEFVEVKARPTTVRTRCDFGSPWFRLAWLCTILRRRTDLDLIYAICDLNRSGLECPDIHGHAGKWYGLIDTQWNVVPDFRICPRDCQYIEVLFPAFRAAFTLLPRAANRDFDRCTMRTANPRFGKIMDLIGRLDEEARSSSPPSAPVLRDLVNLAYAYAGERQCPRDKHGLESLWVYTSDLYEFTACGACSRAVITPAQEHGSDVAMRLNPALRTLPATHAEMGPTCQLYSSRMRRVFARAIEKGGDEGFRYLKYKAQKRKDVELETRQHKKDIKRQLEHLKGFSGPEASAIRDSLRGKLAMVEQEWREWE